MQNQPATSGQSICHAAAGYASPGSGTALSRDLSHTSASVPVQGGATAPVPAQQQPQGGVAATAEATAAVAAGAGKAVGANEGTEGAARAAPVEVMAGPSASAAVMNAPLMTASVSAAAVPPATASAHAPAAGAAVVAVPKPAVAATLASVSPMEAMNASSAAAAAAAELRSKIDALWPTSSTAPKALVLRFAALHLLEAPPHPHGGQLLAHTMEVHRLGVAMQHEPFRQAMPGKIGKAFASSPYFKIILVPGKDNLVMLNVAAVAAAPLPTSRATEASSSQVSAEGGVRWWACVD